MLGNSRQYARDPFAFMSAIEASYGDVARFELGPVETYMLANPADVERVLVADAEKYRKPSFTEDSLGELLGDGLLLSEGSLWREQRDRAQPAFNMSRIGTLAARITDHTEAMLAGWSDGEVRDIEREMATLTVRIIVDAMLGTDLDEGTTRTIQEHLEPLGRRFEPDPFRFAIPDWAPTRENREFRAAVRKLEDVVDDIVERRRGGQYGVDANGDTASGPGADDSGRSNDAPMDLLSILLRAQERGEQSDEQIRDEVMTTLLAGHDTTALALTYTWYLLSEHPEAEATLHAELDSALDGPAPAVGDLRELDHTERVLQESMRLYPPVYVMFREPLVDVRLGGYRVPSGSAVMLPQWAIHRSSRWYDDPLAFDPDRWLPERRSRRPQYAYFPFGGGPRHCIGKQFSLLEARLIVAAVAREFSLSRVDDGPLDLRGSLTMHPANGMRMRLAER